MPSLVTSDLSIRFEDDGPRDGTPVLLLHGWPDDASTWDGVAPVLHRAGLRTITPTLRGFGETRFTSEAAPRTGDSSILAMDAIALLGALGVERFQVAGQDWGSNIAEALAVGWPERVERLAMLSSPPRLGGVPTPSFRTRSSNGITGSWPPSAARRRCARTGVGSRISIGKTGDRPAGSTRRHSTALRGRGTIPTGSTSPSTAIARWDVVPPDPRGAWLEAKVKATKALSLPALYLHGEADGVSPPETAAGVADKFTGPFQQVQLPGVGHFVQREAPAEVARHLLTLFT